MASMNIGGAQPPVGAAQFQGTCRAYPNFDKEADAQALRKAMKGMGTDENAIIAVLCKRTNAQRKDIKNSYKQCFGKDLIHDLKSELGGNFERVILAILMPSEDFDAESLHIAIKGLGTNDDTLIEILCSRTNAELQAAKVAYKRMYKKDLEKDISNDVSGDYGRLLNQMQNACRDEDTAPVNQDKAKKDATEIYNAGEKQMGTDEETFRRIFATRSWPQLNAMFVEYGKLYQRDITQSIKGELSGNFKGGMMAIISCARNRPDFFAERLHMSMKGAGTDERTLTRLVVSRCEKDMVQVKQCFQGRYKSSLDKWISDDVGGDYKKALLALL
jgi:annexin A7/11